jgi:hypothetical protein
MMNSTSFRNDRGAVLPLVLVFAVVLSVVVVAIAKYATTGLRFGQVVEARADRLASADAGLRYGVEELRLGKSTCTTDLGLSGVLTDFNPNGLPLNGSSTAVSCQRIGGDDADTEGWAAILTGGADGSGEFYIHNPSDKSFGGRIYVHDRDKFNRTQGPLTIKQGDLWYRDASCSGSVPASLSGETYFPQSLHGPVCTQATWQQMFSEPVPNVPLTPPAQAPTTSAGCTVWYPGRYTSAEMPAIVTGENYLRTGEYYFDGVDFEVSSNGAIVIGGYADGQYGDTQATGSTLCKSAQDVDRADGGTAGVTMYLSPDASIRLSKGTVEIMRRLQGDRFVSVQQLGTPPNPELSVDEDAIWLKSGGGGGQIDFAAHGLIWAPWERVTFDNVANLAGGAAMGGVVAGAIDVQSPNGVGLVISVDQSPINTKLMITSTATKNDASTSIRAIAQVEPTSGRLVLNSWRVCDLTSC